MALLCPECHHYPSGRTVEGQGHCFCKCHDVADAAPKLLAAFDLADEEIRPHAQNWADLRAAADAARAAIAEAEPEKATA